MGNLVITQLLCVGLIKVNALLVGWEEDALELEGSANSQSFHTLSKKLHITLQGNTVFSQNKYNVCDKLAKVHWHSFWKASSFSTLVVIMVWLMVCHFLYIFLLFFMVRHHILLYHSVRA